MDKKDTKQIVLDNDLFDSVLGDSRMIQTTKKLPDFLALAVQHERECVKLRLRQIQGCLGRIQLLSAGIDYYDTFKKIPGIMQPIPFPKEEYLKQKAKEVNTKDKKRGDDK